MKKRILGVVVMATIATAASWSFNQSKNNIDITELALANVEALANGEVTTPTDCPGGTTLCAWITGGPNGSVTYYKRS